MRAVFRIASLLCIASRLLGQSADFAITPLGGEKRGLMHLVNQLGPDSPDGRFLLVNIVAGADSGWKRLDRTSGQWSVLTNDSFREAAWSPNGRFLAYSRLGGNHRWHLWILPMNPATGLPNGPPRQVSARDGRLPNWSPDSRQIAFQSVDSGRFKTVIIPFNGGDERVLLDWKVARGCRGWSPDGASLYCEYDASFGRRLMLRVSVATGKADTLHAGTALLGLSHDGRYFAEFNPGTRDIEIFATSDARLVQTYRMPPDISVGGWSNASLNLIASRRIIPMNIHAVTLSDGRIVELTKGDQKDQEPVFSPDGRRIAFLRTVNGVARPAVMNADGTGSRVIAGSSDATGIVHGGTGDQMKWSPDGRMVAYIASDLLLHVVDLGTDADRILAGDVDSIQVVSMAWRSDGKGLRYIARHHGKVSQRIVHDVALDGRRQSFGIVPDSLTNASFVNDSTLLFHVTDPKTNAAVGLRLLNIPRGTTQVLHAGPLRGNAGNALLGVSDDQRWIAAIAENGTSPETLRLVSLTGEPSRSIPNPLGGEINEVYFVPGNRTIVASVCATCDNGDEHWDYVAFPVNGDPPRVLTARDPKHLDSNGANVSPDGKTVAYESETVYRSSLLLLTLRGLKP